MGDSTTPTPHAPAASPDSLDTRDTIIAPITGSGSAARASIRLSGASAHSVLDELCGSFIAGSMPSVTRARFPLAHDVMLPVLISRWAAPRSFTGEDCAEIQFAGAPTLVRGVLGVLTSKANIRMATPGEFSARSFLNGRMTIEEAEGVAAMISASGDAELRAARELATGATGAAYRAIAIELTTLLALVEAGVDFTDQEDVVAISPADLRARLAVLMDRCTSLAAASGLVRTGLPRVVLVGAPNAGKSTLFNALLGRARAIESPLRGSTRDVIVEPLDLASHATGAGTVEIADLPGLDERHEGSAAARAAQAAAAAAIAHAEVLVWCDRDGTFDPRALVEIAPHHSVLRIRTFADQPAHAAREPVVAPDLAVSALDPRAAHRVAAAIASKVSESASFAGAAVVPRHRAAIESVQGAISGAVHLLGPAENAAGLNPKQDELIADALRQALDFVGTLVGRIDADEVLGRIFATFCVGK